MLMAASAHFFVLFLGLEIGSISLYVLAGYVRESPRSDEAAVKYFLLGSFASALFIYGVALAYAGTGALAFDEVAAALDGTVPAVAYVALALLVGGLAFKITAAPFHSWAPDVYQGAPAEFVGFMAADSQGGRVRRADADSARCLRAGRGGMAGRYRRGRRGVGPGGHHLRHRPGRRQEDARLFRCRPRRVPVDRAGRRGRPRSPTCGSTWWRTPWCSSPPSPWSPWWRPPAAATPRCGR